jgi:hypothetical protein
LQQVQEIQGYLSREAIVKIGEHLGLPASKIYGVATFYNQFRFRPLGRYHVQVCRGTACHVKGSIKSLDLLTKALKLEPGKTSRRARWSYRKRPRRINQTGRMEPDIVIVDVNTGRPMVGRQWSDGLHQSCQAKEGLKIRQETQTVATVTIQDDDAVPAVACDDLR